MNIFYVYAHPEPTSFNAVLKDHAVAELGKNGDSVVVSDLHAMNFNAVHSRADFQTVGDTNSFRYGREQNHAGRNDSFAPDIQAEIDKLFACDVLILQFPLWWFSVPAILKGWIDRVFAYSAVYDHERFYDRGLMSGRRAMCAITVGATPAKFAPDGCNGDLMTNLWPIHNGWLNYVGFDVLPPFVVHNVGTRLSPEEKPLVLDSYSDRLRSLSTITPLDLHSRDDFDEELRLKPGTPPKRDAIQRFG